MTLFYARGIFSAFVPNLRNAFSYGIGVVYPSNASFTFAASCFSVKGLGRK